MKTIRHLCTTIYILSTIIVALPLQANDGTYYTSGNQLVPLQETDISVRREVLTISLLDNGNARVDVYYEFWNPSSSIKQVLMGFEADPWCCFKVYNNGKHPYIYDFTVDFNDLQLDYRTAVCRTDTHRLAPIDTTRQYYVHDDYQLYSTEDWTDEVGVPFAYVYYFDACFESGLNRVHHTYTYRMDDVVCLPFHLNYKLTPAARWANGQIDDFTLVIRADSTAKHFLIPNNIFPENNYTVIEGTGKIRTNESYYYNEHTEITLRNGAVQLHLTNFRPEEEFEILAASFYSTSKTNNGPWPVGCYYDRSNQGWLWFDDGHLAPADTAFRLRVIHNLPFAHRGHVFRDKQLREYFEAMWWYMPDPLYKDNTDDFTEIDWMYVNYTYRKEE